MHPEKKIDIEMKSKYAGTHYNLYSLDTTNRKWVYEGKDKVIIKEEIVENEMKDAIKYTYFNNDTSFIFSDDKLTKTTTDPEENSELKIIQDEIVVIQEDIKKIEKTEPEKPEKATDKRFRFDLDVKKEEFPEMEVYEGMEFEIGAENKNFDPKLTNKDWQDIALTKVEGKYVLVLKRYLSNKEIKNKSIKSEPIRTINRKSSEGNKLYKKYKGTGTIKGKMVDKEDSKPLPFANIILFQKDLQIAGSITDFNGKFIFPNLASGKYRIKATYVGFLPISINNIVVNDKKITFVADIKTTKSSGNFNEFEVIEYKIPTLDDSASSSMEIRRFIVYPVFEGQNYIDAMKTFDEKFDTYSKKLNTRKEDERIKKEEYEKKLAEIKAENERRQKEWEEKATHQQKVQRTTNQVYRAFSVYKFGTHNCDSPVRWPSGQTVLASFSDSLTKELNISRLFLVEKSRNGVFSYNPTYDEKFKFNPKAKNIIIGITNNNKLITFTQKQFKTIPKETKKYNFKMNELPTPTTVKELKKCISVL